MSSKTMLAATVLLAAALSAAGVATMGEGARAVSLPELRVALGMEYRDVEKGSTLAVAFRKTGIHSESFLAFHSLSPHRFNYAHPKLGFTLSEAKGISIAAETGRVEQITINPQLTLLTLDEALDKCRLLVEMIDGVGWKRDLRKFKNMYSGDTLTSYDSMANIRAAFLGSGTQKKMSKARIASWTEGLEEMEIDLAQQSAYHGMSDPHEEPKYLITVTLGYSVVPPPWASGQKRGVP